MPPHKLSSIQALRGIAALMVCFFHLATHRDSSRLLLDDTDKVKSIALIGPTGVFVFFVISGFVMPFAMNRSGYQWKKAWAFLKKRIIRLHPPYIFTLVLTVGVLLYNDYSGISIFDFRWSAFLNHFTFTAKIAGYDWYNPIFWTLAIELQYYILIAFLFLGINHEKWMIRVSVITILCFLSILWRNNAFIFAYIAPFVLGIGLYLYKVKQVKLMEFLYYFTISSFIIWKFFGWHWLYASWFAVVVMLFTQLNFRPLQFLGKISYSLYLIHPMVGGLVIYLLMPYVTDYWQNYLVLSAGIVGSGIAAYLMYRIIERPSIAAAENSK